VTAVDDDLVSEGGDGIEDIIVTLSNAQELIQRSSYEDQIEWSVANRNADTIRRLINVAKYAIGKAVPGVRFPVNGQPSPVPLSSLLTLVVSLA